MTGFLCMSFMDFYLNGFISKEYFLLKIAPKIFENIHQFNYRLLKKILSVRNYRSTCPYKCIEQENSNKENNQFQINR